MFCLTSVYVESGAFSAGKPLENQVEYYKEGQLNIQHVVLIERLLHGSFMWASLYPVWGH